MQAGRGPLGVWFRWQIERQSDKPRSAPRTFQPRREFGKPVTNLGSCRKIEAPRRFGRPGADHSPRAHGLRNRNAQGDNTSPGLTLSKAPSGQPLYHRLPNCGGLQSSALDIRKGSEGAHSAREDDQRSREDRGLSENREENLFGSS